MVPNFCFGETPEVWIKHEKWLQIIERDTYKKKVLFIAADEARCVPKSCVQVKDRPTMCRPRLDVA